MISNFYWNGSPVITEKEKREVEDSLRQTFEDRGYIELKPCHDGQVRVQLNIDGPLNTILFGNITCSCGKKYCTFRGSSDASTVTFERVE
jgi:hypothetical protein